MSFWGKLKSTVLWRGSISDGKGWQEALDREGSERPVTETSVLGLSAAWACVNLLAGTIASLPLMVYRTGPTGVRSVAKDHPLYRLLHDRPNYDQTSVDFWEFGAAAIELHGNFFAQVGRAGDRVVDLTPIYERVTVDWIDGNLRYRWSEYGKAYDVGQDEILHIRGFGGGPLGGMSTIAAGRQTFGLAVDVNTAARKTFANGMRPSGVIGFDAWLTKEQREIIETKLVDKYAGAMNAGRPLVLEGGTKWTQLTINPEDAQLLQSRGFSIEEVCRFFGVPPFMIGHTEKSTSWGKGIEQQTLGFQKFTLRRRLKRIEQALEQQLLAPRDRAAGVTIEFNIEGLLRGDSAGRATFYKDMTGIGAMTINEVRKLENLPPVAGGDVPRMQMQNVPITEAQGIADEDETPELARAMPRIVRVKDAAPDVRTKGGVTLDLKAVGDDGTFEGYGSVFNVVDSYNEVVLPGAFIGSLAKRKASGIKLLWQHDPGQPIGVWEDLAEDSKGLWGRGRLLIDVSPKAREAYGLLKAGALDGLSIGYREIKTEPHPDKNGVLRLLELDLREISIVTFAANERARVESVKTEMRAMFAKGETPPLSMIEKLLRDGGFPDSLATAFVSLGKAAFRRSDSGDETNQAARFLELLKAG